MTHKNQSILFATIAIICEIIIVKINSPLRNFVPVIWAGYGFVFHAVLFFIYWMQTNKQLITNYKDLLNNLHISVYKMGYKERIDMLVLLTHKELASSVDNETKAGLKSIKFYLRLVYISFVVIILLAISTILIK